MMSIGQELEPGGSDGRTLLMFSRRRIRRDGLVGFRR
jgi:hypothetical protein